MSTSFVTRFLAVAILVPVSPRSFPPAIVATAAIEKSEPESALLPMPIETEGEIGYAALLADGRLLAPIYGVEGAMDKRSKPSTPQQVLGRFSKDDGIHWGHPQFLFTLPETRATPGEMVPLRTRDGAIHIFGYNFLSAQRPHWPARLGADIWHAVSRDGGKSWEGPHNINWGHQYTGSLNSAIELKSGRMLLPFSYLAIDSPTGTLARSNGLFVSDAIFSDDGGKTWRNSKNDVAVDCGGPDDHSGALEPVVVELADGRVWMVIRTQTGYLFESYSHDGGESWSAPRRTLFHSSSAPAAVLRLKDGRLVLVWSNEPYAHGTKRLAPGSRQSLVMAINDGGGWKGYREICPPFGPEDKVGAAYPHLAEADDGSVLVVYFEGWRTVGGKQRPGWHHRLVRVDPNWLLEREAKEDFSQGIRNFQLAGTAGVQVLPGPDGTPALRLQKLKGEQPSGATWNFPLAREGSVHIKLRIESGFQGAYFTLSEYFLQPSNREGGTFRWMIGPDGKVKIQDVNEGPYLQFVSKQREVLKLKSSVEEGQTHDLSVAWNCETNVAELRIDGHYVAQLVGLETATGMAYLRLFSAAPTADFNGLWVSRLRSHSEP